MHVFKWVQRFQERVSCEIFENEEDIADAVIDQEYDKREEKTAVHLSHVNGTLMSVIYHSKEDPESVHVVLIETVDYNHDWIYLKDAIS